MSAQVVMLASGKGGTGKSTASVLIGGSLAALGRKVLLVELDSGLRSVDILSGVYGRTVYDLQDVLCGRCVPDKAVVASPLYPGLSVISAPYEGGSISQPALAALVYALEPYFDFLLLDTAAGMGQAFQAARAAARHALLVLTPDPIALRDGRIISDRLYDTGVTDLRLIMNRVTARSFGSHSAVRDLDECIDTVCARLLGVIPESRRLQAAMQDGALPPKDCPALLAAGNIARRLLGKRVPLEYY